MREIDDAVVAAVLDPAAARQVVRDTLVAAAHGLAFGPVRAVVVMEGAWFGAMPAYVDTGAIRALGAKLVAAFPGNSRRGLATHQAKIALFDPDTGRALAIVGGDTITRRRTAAVSVVATETLARMPRGAYAILGAGEQAFSHLEAFADARLVTSLRVWSRTRSRAEALAWDARARGIDATVTDDANDAVRGADVVVTATAAPDSLFDVASAGPNVHVNAVGACVPTRRELPGAFVARAEFFVDSRDAALREAGDLLLAMPEHGLDASHIRGELGDVLAGKGPPPSGDRPTIYESLGLGIFDVACAAYVLAGRR
jgi:ornithine cyclodeaminase